MAGECIRFGSKSSQTEMDNKIELREEFGPPGLLMSEETRGRKVLKVFVVRDHVDEVSRPFKVSVPGLKSPVDRKEFFIMSVVVEFHQGETMRDEGNRVDFPIGLGLGQNGCNCIVRGVRFDNDRGVQGPVRRDGSGGEGSLEFLEGCTTLVRELLRSSLSSKTSEWQDNSRVIMNKLAVEVREAQEGLDIVDFSGFRPVLNHGNFGWVHGQAFRREDEAKVFHRVCVELTFVHACVESVCV
jgi:hypothetical protein